ncbi:MAG: M13 family metallopeptidase [Gemmatimonadota bacterium]
MIAPDRRIRARLLVTLAAFFCLCTWQTLVAQEAQSRPIDPANIDTTCAPCKDFALFANGGWLKRATIPGDQPAWGSFNELQDANFAALHSILDSAAAEARTTKNPNTRKLGLFYASCMDSSSIETAGIKPLAHDLALIAGIHDRPEIQTTLARLKRYGISVPFGFSSRQDAKNSSRVIAGIGQSGLGLPDRDYYLRADTGSVALREKYVAHITTMFRLAGDDSSAAAKGAEAVLSLENALAQASMTRVEQRNPDSTYHLLSIAEVRKLAPDINWNAYFTGIGIAPATEINVSQPRFLAAADSLLREAPVTTWKSYLRWHLLANSASALDARFDDESFRFNSGVLTGVTQQHPRWRRCLERTDRSLGEILGQAYVETHFTPEAKARALQMVKNVQAEFRSRLKALTWMSDATKQKAYAKLNAIVNKIGYPDKWRDYSALQITPGDFLHNTRQVAAFATARDLAKIGKPLDRSEWGMTPPTVNAYYSSSLNEIVFPAGIMQPPFFNPQADDAVNYGGMGAVIGHELTHGFDDQGRKFDARGNLSGWWSDADAAAFTSRADIVADQFDGYVAVDSLHVNGHLTLGENLADLGGLTIAYGAYRRSLEGKPEPEKLDGYTGPQRFFLAWAQVWRNVARPEYTRLLVNTNPHAPAVFRIIGPLSNMPEFAEAFSCKPGDTMVREMRAEVW